MQQPKKFSIGDRVIGKVHPYLSSVWARDAGPYTVPTETSCSGIIIKQFHNAMFLIKTDENKLLACSHQSLALDGPSA